MGLLFFEQHYLQVDEFFSFCQKKKVIGILLQSVENQLLKLY